MKSAPAVACVESGLVPRPTMGLWPAMPAAAQSTSRPRRHHRRGPPCTCLLVSDRLARELLGHGSRPIHLDRPLAVLARIDAPSRQPIRDRAALATAAPLP